MTFELLPTMTPWFVTFAAIAGVALVLTVVALGSVLRSAVARPGTRTTSSTTGSTTGTATSTATSTRRLPVASGHVRHA